MTHTITWDHDDCEHDLDHDEHWCAPQRATVTCDDAACPHRLTPVADRDLYDEGWHECPGGTHCTAGVEGEAEWRVSHLDPGAAHTTLGHLLKVGEHCNAAEWLSSDWYLGGTVDEYRDGPIEVEWEGDGYQWAYAGD